MQNHWGWFRLITPILVTVNLFLMGQLFLQMNDLNQRIFQHMTNADLHVTKQEITELRHTLLEAQRELQRQILDELRQGR